MLQELLRMSVEEHLNHVQMKNALMMIPINLFSRMETPKTAHGSQSHQQILNAESKNIASMEHPLQMLDTNV